MIGCLRKWVGKLVGQSFDENGRSGHAKRHVGPLEWKHPQRPSAGTTLRRAGNPRAPSRGFWHGEWNALPLKIINQRTETSRDWEASAMNQLGQAVNALQTGSGTSLAVENIPAMHDPTQPASASECEIA